MKNKISIIIPVYNVKNYLKKCLDSVINQTYKNIEIILINDGSNDGSEKICYEYAKKYKEIVYISSENKGVSHARNIGIKRSTGEYIGFVDSDDFIEPNMYEILLKNAIKFNADISIGNYTNKDKYDMQKIVNMARKLNTEEAISNLFSEKSIRGFLWNKLYKRELIIGKKEILLNEKIKIMEDLLFNYYAFKNSKTIVYDSNELYHYILRENSALQSINSKKDITRLLVLDEIINDISFKHIQNQLKYNYVIFSSEALYYNRNNKNFNNLIKKRREYIKYITFETNMAITKKIKILIWYFFTPFVIKIKKIGEKRK